MKKPKGSFTTHLNHPSNQPSRPPTSGLFCVHQKEKSMKTFKSISDLEQLRNNPLQDTVKEIISPYIEDPTYRPENDGYVALLEPADLDRVLSDLDMPWRLLEVPFEAVTMIGTCFHAAYIPNNQFVLSILVPNEEWLPGDARQHLEDHLDP
jgi:hypothetical protein